MNEEIEKLSNFLGLTPTSISERAGFEFWQIWFQPVFQVEPLVYPAAFGPQFLSDSRECLGRK